jgi:hypothetical protein
MKKSIILWGCGFALLAACNSKEQPKEQQKVINSSKLTTETQLTNPTLNVLLTSYLQIADALIKADSLSTLEVATGMEYGLSKSNSYSQLAPSVHALSGSASLAKQREAFVALSMQMIKLVKQNGLQSGEIFVAHCPMANSDKGASWLARKSIIRNPYYGDKMLECGEIVERLKQK